MRILAVDDDDDSREVERSVLARCGYPDVVAAHTGEEALRLLGLAPAPGDAPPPSTDVELVLLDLVLPDLDGLAICRRMQDVEHLREVPVILVTARDDERTLEQALEAGAHDFLSKPFRPIDLIARVRAAMRFREESACRRQREAELQRLTGTDALTGIANRRLFDQVLQTEWRRAAREGTPLSLIVGDLDHFHEFNERYGHLGGDACLQTVAATLRVSLARGGDLVARYGGEEFAVILPQTDAPGARQVAEALRARIRLLGIPHEGSPVAPMVTMSLGHATVFPRADLTPDSLIAAADQALYRAKRNGRDQCAGGRVRGAPGEVTRPLGAGLSGTRPTG